MKKYLASIAVIIFAVSFFAYQQTAESRKLDSAKTFSEIKPQVMPAVAFGVSEKVSSFALASPEIGITNKQSAEEKARAVPNREPFRKQVADASHDTDAAIANFSAVPMPAPALSFDGLSSNDTTAAFGFRVVPPDPNGDVGPNHYVQSVKRPRLLEC